MADLTPQGRCRHACGVGYHPLERVERALAEFFSEPEPGGVCGTGFAAGYAGSRPQLSEFGNRGRSTAAGTGADCGVHQFESGGAVFDRAWGAHGAALDGDSLCCTWTPARTRATRTSEPWLTTCASRRVWAQGGENEGKVVAEKVAEFVRENHIRRWFSGGRPRKGGRDISIYRQFISFCATHPRWMFQS